MQPRAILTVIAIAAFVMGAQAANYTWVGGELNHETDWSREANWISEGELNPPYPDDSGDTATVGTRDNDPELTENILVGSVTIQSGGEVKTGAYTLTIDGSGGMDIQAGGTVDVNNASGSVVLSGDATHYISKSGSDVGRLYLRDSGSTLSITTYDAPISYSGSPGEIAGEHNGALITIAESKTLTSVVDIVGAMEIRAGSGTFQNDGVVDANDATTEDTRDRLTAYNGTFTGSGQWNVTEASAYLEFAAGITASAFTGVFTVDGNCGWMVFKENVTTEGGLTTGDGHIDVDAGNSKTFTYLSGKEGETTISSDQSYGSCS